MNESDYSRADVAGVDSGNRTRGLRGKIRLGRWFAAIWVRAV